MTYTRPMSPLTSHFTRYVIRQLIIGTAVVTAGLLFVVWLTQSLRFIQFVMGKGLSIQVWLNLTLLMLPPSLAMILPIALFAVVAFVYNRLALDRELVVLQSAGLSRVGLAQPAIIVGIVTVILAYGLSLAVVPASMRAFKDLQWSIRNDVSQVLLREGAFNQVAEGLMVYVRDRAADGAMLGLLIQDTRGPESAVTLMAKRGIVEASDGGSAIRLFDGSRQQRGAGDSYTVLTFDTYAVDLGELANGGESRWLDNGERTAAELLTLTEADGHSATTVRRMRADAHSRFSSPLLCLALTLIAVAWLLTGEFDRGGALRRILGATATVIAVEVGTLGAFALAARHGSWIAVMYLTCVIPIAAALYILSAPRIIDITPSTAVARTGLAAP